MAAADYSKCYLLSVFHYPPHVPTACSALIKHRLALGAEILFLFVPHTLNQTEELICSFTAHSPFPFCFCIVSHSSLATDLNTMYHSRDVSFLRSNSREL